MDILFYDSDEVKDFCLSPYEGYNWYSDYTELSEDNVALRITRGKDVSIIPLNALPRKDDDPQSGLVDSLEVIYLQAGQEQELIKSLEQAVLLGEDNENLYGYLELYNDRIWIWQDVNINNSLDYLEECLTSLWEASSESDSDSWDTQLDEFRDTLRTWWENIFLLEDKERLSIGRAVRRTSWQFDNATLMVIKENAVYLSSAMGTIVKLSEQDEIAIRKIIKQQEKILTA